MNTYLDAKKAARAIVGDPDGEFMTDSYLGPMANHCYESIILDLSETCSPYITAVAVVPNIQPGVSDLKQFATDPSKPLFGLVNPLREGVDWKLHGTPDTSYQPVKQVDKLPDYPPRNIAIDLRVRGEFRPPPLLKETDSCQIHPFMSTALAEQLAACVMRERSNPGQMQSFSLVGSEVLDNIKNQLMRSQQGTAINLGRMNSRGMGFGRGWANYYLNSLPGLPGGICFEWREYTLWITP